MNNKEKIRVEAGESDFVNERFADSMAENIRSLLRGIRNSVRGLIRNVAFAAQMSAAALGVVDCSPFPDSELDTPLQCDNSMPAEPVVKEVAVCFMRWNNAVDLTEEIRARLEAAFDLTSRFFTEATFGRDLYHFNLIDSGIVWAGPAPAAYGDEFNFAIEACAPQIEDFDQVDTFAVIPSTANSHRSYADIRTVHTPHGDREMALIGLAGYYAIQLRHELGHADYLWNHATAYVCYDGEQEVTYSPDPDHCSIDNYGNLYDVMGGGLIAANFPIVFGHPGGFEKSLSGLVKVTNITENSGQYPLAAIEAPCSNLAQLIRVPYSKLPLCLEYRRPIGFDADFSEENISNKLGFKAGLPPDGCVFLQICSNDPTTLGFRGLGTPFNGTSFLLRQNHLSNRYIQERLGTCIPREGFRDSNLGIDVNYTQSATNPNAVMVHVSGVDEARLAKSPNLKIESRVIKNVSETGESVGSFNVQISGKRKSDGLYEVIETRTINGLPLFGRVGIDFSPDQLATLRLNYADLQFIVDPENNVEETDEADNQSTFSLGE